MRLLLLIDSQNLFYSAKNAFGSDALVDYQLLKEEAILNRRFTSIRCIAFMPFVSQREKIEPVLKSYGYEVLPEHPAKGRLKDSDVLLATVGMATTADVVVVASGDADYCPLYRALKSRGVRVEVLAFPNSLGGEVKDCVDEIRYLEKGILFQRAYHREVLV